MTRDLRARIAAIGEAAARRTAKAAAARIAAALPGIAVEAVGTEVVLRARGLERRLARDPVLRWIGSLWR